MKNFVLTLAAVTAFTGSAIAADLPARTYTKVPAAVSSPIYNWGGFYLGMNGGGGSAHKCWDLTAVGLNNAPVVPLQAEGCHSATGGTVGGQVGYRWQASNWVFGVEAQGNWANFKGSNVNQSVAIARIPLAVNDLTKMDAFGLFTGQIGYAFNNVLIYAKGGAAVVSDKYTNTFTSAALIVQQGRAFAGDTFATGSETRWGSTAGAGIEYGFAPNWSIALEYDHLFMGRKNVTFNLVAPQGPGISASRDISQGVDIGTVRVNYTFGGPAVARY
jgi:outer membrane immunogenic protein